MNPFRDLLYRIVWGKFPNITQKGPNPQNFTAAKLSWFTVLILEGLYFLSNSLSGWTKQAVTLKSGVKKCLLRQLRCPRDSTVQCRAGLHRESLSNGRTSNIKCRENIMVCILCKVFQFQFSWTPAHTMCLIKDVLHISIRPYYLCLMEAALTGLLFFWLSPGFECYTFIIRDRDVVLSTFYILDDFIYLESRSRSDPWWHKNFLTY